MLFLHGSYSRLPLFIFVQFVPVLWTHGLPEGQFQFFVMSFISLSCIVVKKYHIPKIINIDGIISFPPSLLPKVVPVLRVQGLPEGNFKFLVSSFMPFFCIAVNKIIPYNQQAHYFRNHIHTLLFIVCYSTIARTMVLSFA